MSKNLDRKSYKKYMMVVEDNIKETERRMEMLPKSKKVIQLSYDDWVEILEANIKILTQNKDE